MFNIEHVYDGFACDESGVADYSRWALQATGRHWAVEIRCKGAISASSNPLEEHVLDRTILLNSSHAASIIGFRVTLIQQLIERGYSVHVTAPDLSEADHIAVAGIGATLHAMPLSRRGLSAAADLRYLWAQRRLIRSLRPEMVIGYTVKPNIWGSLAAGAEGVASASMVTGLGHVFAEGAGLKYRLIRRIMVLLYRAATDKNQSVIFQNPDDLHDFVSSGCLGDPEKAHVVNGSGVDTVAYSMTPLPNAPVFLLLARLLRSKGVAEFIGAARIVRAVCTDARFRIGGFFDEGGDALGEAEFHSLLAHDVEYLGHLTDVRPAIAGCSVFVLPSYREGTPRSVLEAMAMGRPIITTDVPGCRETTVEGENGFLVPPKDVGALVDAMLRLASDAKLRARMGDASRVIAQTKYAAETVTADLVRKLGL